MTLLLTGYEPFGEHDRNPSAEVARELDGREISGHEVVGEVLPVEFERAGEEMERLIDRHDPAVVVATGLAAGRTAVSVERVGVNVADCADVPDNADAEPRDERLRADDAVAYFATLPVVSVVEALLADGVPARVSNTAGTHCCNDLLYRTRAFVERESLDVPVGFVHLPLTPEQAAGKAREGAATAGRAVQPSLSPDRQVAAIRRTFEVAIEER